MVTLRAWPPATGLVIKQDAIHNHISLMAYREGTMKLEMRNNIGTGLLHVTNRDRKLPSTVGLAFGWRNKKHFSFRTSSTGPVLNVGKRQFTLVEPSPKKKSTK